MMTIWVLMIFSRVDANGYGSMGSTSVQILKTADRETCLRLGHIAIANGQGYIKATCTQARVG